MFKVVVNISILIITGFIIANILSLVILSSEGLSSIFVTKKFGNETYQALEKSKILSSSDNIIIGDSVARHIFSAENMNTVKYYNLASNVWASLIGQYIIATNALSVNKQIKTIYLFYHPDSFQNDLDQPWTYSYVVKPFYTSEYRNLFSENAIKRLRQNRFFSLFELPIAKTLPIFNQIDYSDKKEWRGFPNVQQRPYLSGISIEYLKKMDRLCLGKNVTLSVVMPPISKKYDTDFSMMKMQINANALNNIFDGYFENEIILADLYFRDGIHIKKNYLTEIYDIVDAALPRRNRSNE